MAGVYADQAINYLKNTTVMAALVFTNPVVICGAAASSVVRLNTLPAKTILFPLAKHARGIMFPELYGGSFEEATLRLNPPNDRSAVFSTINHPEFCPKVDP